MLSIDSFIMIIYLDVLSHCSRGLPLLTYSYNLILTCVCYETKTACGHYDPAMVAAIVPLHPLS